MSSLSQSFIVPFQSSGVARVLGARGQNEFGQIRLLPLAFGKIRIHGYERVGGGSLCVWPSQGRIKNLGAGESDGVAGNAVSFPIGVWGRGPAALQLSHF